MLRTAILAAAGNERVRHLVSTVPISRDIVRRYVAGESVDDALRVCRELGHAGLRTSLDRLGEDCTDETVARATTRAYVDLLRRIEAAGLADRAEVSLKLSSVGQAQSEALATDNAAAICAAAQDAGTMVTFDMEEHATVDSTLGILAVLRKDFPSIGAVVQAYLRRAEGDCRELAYEGSRVRLCKGAYSEPESVAFHHRDAVDKSYVRCLNGLMSSPARPLVATHDPRLIAIAGERARWYGRALGSYEFQMLYGVRPDEQRRLAERGETVRVYVPYGDDWYRYLMRRLAERPANVGFFLRSLVSRK